ncbi:hypothetical protein M426DRAFT_325768 [Hypoxylon sp. CI-4A]|nr:hypothetical protein M426DRAFT_325768 [Hypoxylon sp. CI-4A]
MVYVPIARPNGATRLNAYLLVDLTDEQLNTFKKQFEYGTMATFATMLELIIKRAPADYLNKPHAYIRTKENEAGRDDPFVLIDEQVVSKNAIWYVEQFADETDVEDELAESTSVLWQILIETEHLPICYINYEVGNMDIREDLSNTGVDYLVPENYEQPNVATSALDMADFRRQQNADVIAEPGEYEISTDPKLLDSFAPRPESVARLKGDVAKKAGVLNGWTFYENKVLERVSDGEYPEGTITLQHLYYDPDFPWPAYEWPDESSTAIVGPSTGAV